MDEVPCYGMAMKGLDVCSTYSTVERFQALEAAPEGILTDLVMNL